MEKTDNRRFHRLESCLIASFRILDAQENVTLQEDAVAVNISKTGMLLQTGSYIEPGSNMDVAVEIDGKSVQLKCRSMYCRKKEGDEYESGIQILRINKKTIDDYFSLIRHLETQNLTPSSLRPETGLIKDVVLRIASEHKIINKYVVVLSEMLDAAVPDILQTVSLMHLMHKDIRIHFNIEENLFFDIARKTLPPHCGEIVSRLTLDHREILREIEAIISSLQYPSEGVEGIVTPPLKVSISALLEKVKVHAKIEVKELFPMLENNVEAKQLILQRMKDITG